MESKEKLVFVTVGTTLFENLIQTISSSTSFLSLLSYSGYDELVIQYGKGSPPSFSKDVREVSTDDHNNTGTRYYQFESNTREKPLFSPSVPSSSRKPLKISCYRFKTSIREDMQRANLIISHAGAGSIMESLSLKKKTCVVINRDLMDNHQMELAEALCERGFLYMVVKPEELIHAHVMKDLHEFEPKEWKGGDVTSFGTFMASFMGFQETHDLKHD